jgi:hypothetical protein
VAESLKGFKHGAEGRDDRGCLLVLKKGPAPIVDCQLAVAISGQGDRNRSFRGLPRRRVAQVTDHHRHTPVVWERLIEVIFPEHLIVGRRTVRVDQGLFHRAVVVDKLIKAIDRTLQIQVLAADQRPVAEVIALQHTMVCKGSTIDQFPLIVPHELTGHRFPERGLVLAPVGLRRQQEGQDFLGHHDLRCRFGIVIKRNVVGGRWQRGVGVGSDLVNRSGQEEQQGNGEQVSHGTLPYVPQRLPVYPT